MIALNFPAILGVDVAGTVDETVLLTAVEHALEKDRIARRDAVERADLLHATIH